MIFKYGIDHLTIEIIDKMIKRQCIGKVTDEAREKVAICRSHVDQISQSDRAVYGINTGFGPLCDTRISAEDTTELQRRLLLSHAVGVGDPIDPTLVKIMMICKVHALCLGYSGACIGMIERIIYFIDHDLTPLVPEQGSVGASGDLAPLSHLFLPLIGNGDFWIEGKSIPATNILAQHQLSPLKLKSKEGLALINGTQFILAHTIVGLLQMDYLLHVADLAGAMSLEGYQGSKAPFSAVLHSLRPFVGTQKVAAHMRSLLSESENMASHTNCSRVQDPYSIRCIPQVHGASRNAHRHLMELTEIEMNSVTDNPIVISAEETISGGNFHGQPLAMAIDYTALAAAELGNISDRRSYLLIEGKHGLPRLLIEESGLNSGLMIPQYTTAALVTENKSLCFPPSADSIPTSLGQEDHVSMGSISSRKFIQILGNVEKIIAIELMYAAQALDFRRPLKSSEIIELNHQIIRDKVAHLDQDRPLKKDIYAMITLVRERAFVVNPMNKTEKPTYEL